MQNCPVTAVKRGTGVGWVETDAETDPDRQGLLRDHRDLQTSELIRVALRGSKKCLLMCLKQLFILRKAFSPNST